ncbi:MAG: hypothetical protein NVS2B4_04830 [Ramlibacter sp.]
MTTILAAFDKRLAADQALERLASSGIPRDDLHVEHDFERLRNLKGSQRIGHDSVLGSAGRMFADLVRTNVDHHQLDVATEALERGATVLVVRVTQPTQVDGLVARLRAEGAYNVSTRAAAEPPH